MRGLARDDRGANIYYLWRRKLVEQLPQFSAALPAHSGRDSSCSSSWRSAGWLCSERDLSSSLESGRIRSLECRHGCLKTYSGADSLEAIDQRIGEIFRPPVFCGHLAIVVSTLFQLRGVPGSIRRRDSNMPVAPCVQFKNPLNAFMIGDSPPSFRSVAEPRVATRIAPRSPPTGKRQSGHCCTDPAAPMSMAPYRFEQSCCVIMV